MPTAARRRHRRCPPRTRTRSDRRTRGTPWGTRASPASRACRRACPAACGGSTALGDLGHEPRSAFAATQASAAAGALMKKQLGLGWGPHNDPRGQQGKAPLVRRLISMQMLAKVMAGANAVRWEAAKLASADRVSSKQENRYDSRSWKTESSSSRSQRIYTGWSVSHTTRNKGRLNVGHANFERSGPSRRRSGSLRDFEEAYEARFWGSCCLCAARNNAHHIGTTLEPHDRASTKH